MILILLVTIGGVIYYTIYKNVTDRETFDGKTVNLGNIPVDTTNNIFDLYNDAMEFDDLVHNYIDMLRL